MQVVAVHGWLKAGTDVMDGIADIESFDRVDPLKAAFCGTGVPLDAYQGVYRIEDFHAIGHDPALLSLYDRLLGGHVLRQPLSIARRVQLGGLTVLVGSHADGLLTYHACKGAGELEAYICNSGHNWGIADFRAGDVLTFTSLTVHRSQPNIRGQQVRLSLDMRYQRDDEPITHGPLTPHCDILSWDEVYQGWTDESLQYYWNDRNLQLVDHDEELRWQKHKIC